MLLFSSLLTVMWGVYESAEISTMMEKGSESNVTLNNLDISRIDNIKQNIFIEKASISYVLGNIVNEGIEQLDSRLIYGDYEYTKMRYIYLEEGKMPVNEDEVLVSRKMLNLLKTECRIGSVINLKVKMNDDNNEYLEKAFVISGIYDGKINSNNNDVIVTEKLFKTLEDSGYKTLKNIGQADIKLKSTFFINNQINEIEKDISESEKINADINWTYKYVFSKEICFIILLIILLIMCSGYLIIYNILNMSVVQDIKLYGILKTLGTTNNQIKRLLYNQILYFLVIAIPLGSICGYFVGRVVLPMINNIMMDNVLINIETELNVNPWIFFISALLTSIVVVISINRSYKTAEKISPIEAMKYNEIDVKNIVSRFDFKGKIYEIPLINILRNKRKTILVVISLSMGLILFNVVFNVVLGFKRDNYIEQSMEVQYDYRIENKYFASHASSEIDDNTGIEDELITELKNKGFIREGGGLSIVKCNKISSDISEDDDICIFTLDDFFIDKYEQNNNIKNLKNGNYIILDSNYYNNYNVGDSITLKYDDSSTQRYEIIGLLNFKEDLNLNINDETNAAVIWYGNAKDKYKKGKLERYYFDAQSSINACEINEFLKKYIDQKDSSIIYRSKEYIENRYNSMKEYYVIVGVTIVVLTGLIGVLNYINSIFTEMISSSKVFALLEVIGMTKKEIVTMLIYKGVFYSIFTTIIEILFMLIFDLLSGSRILTIVPILISSPFLFIFSVIIPLISYNKVVRGNELTSIRIF